MKPDWTMTILICFVAASGFGMLSVLAAEAHQVHFGSDVTLGCNILYLHDTVWLKQNPDLVPTVVLHARVKDGRPFEVFRLSPRHSASLMNRSLALRISGVQAGDLGLYYCIAIMNEHTIIGGGIWIQNSSQSQFRLCYSVAVCSGLLIMIITVCITHWKARQKKLKTTKQELQQTKTENTVLCHSVA